MSAPTRRGVLGGIAALGAILPASAAELGTPALRWAQLDWSGPIPPVEDGPHPDAALIELAERWLALDRSHTDMLERRGAAERRGDTAEAERLEALEQSETGLWCQMLDDAFQMQPKTLDGLRVQARIVLAYHEHSPSSTEDVMAFNFAEYVLTLTGGVPAS
ncbi:hypothetical protein [Muricoccus radiodurans]|uniref:hypothetical protein n=1 Tax=Muricoccus radiodurans TaxID=2231721 RepID=UPI003CE7E3F2